MKPIAFASVDIVIIGKEWAKFVPSEFVQIAERQPCLFAFVVLTVRAEVAFESAGTVEVAFANLDLLPAMRAGMRLSPYNGSAVEEIPTHCSALHARMRGTGGEHGVGQTVGRFRDALVSIVPGPDQAAHVVYVRQKPTERLSSEVVAERHAGLKWRAILIGAGLLAVLARECRYLVHSTAPLTERGLGVGHAAIFTIGIDGQLTRGRA